MNWLHLNHAVISKIIEKTPIRYAFARRLACLDPVRIATSTTQAASQFKLVIDHLVKQQHLEGRSSDEFGSMLNLLTVWLGRIYQYSKSFTSTNSASMVLQPHVANSGSFPKLWDVMRVVLILSHGQLSVEKDVYQPSGHGREPEGLVLHCTEDHPWSLVALWWFGCRHCRQATSIGSSKWSSKVPWAATCRQSESGETKGWCKMRCRMRSWHLRRGRKRFSVPWCPWPRTLILCQSKPRRRTTWR